jgi:hypothetical protein
VFSIWVKLDRFPLFLNQDKGMDYNIIAMRDDDGDKVRFNDTGN